MHAQLEILALMHKITLNESYADRFVAMCHTHGYHYLIKLENMGESESHRQVISSQEQDFEPIEALSKRETAILELISAGNSNKDIGEKLNIKENTVKWHINNIFQKLDVTNRTAAVIKAINAGIIKQ